MICYKDRAFCDQPGCKQFNDCSRSLKIKDVEEAKKADLPIDIGVFRDCYDPKEIK